MSYGINTLRRIAGTLCRAVSRDVHFDDHVNTPIRFVSGEWYVNERVVELAFVHHHVEMDGRGKRALEFGCTRSELAIQLASMGYEVTGIDLREYPFSHPDLKAVRMNVLDLDDKGGFDIITVVSVIEHVGLGAYGEASNREDLKAVIVKLVELLKPGGRLLITTPVGKPHQDEFLRSFDPEDLIPLVASAGVKLVDEQYYRRTDLRVWTPCDRTAMSAVSNEREDCGPTGVNGVGCFAWQKNTPAL